jgi:hypothetical protein
VILALMMLAAQTPYSQIALSGGGEVVVRHGRVPGVVFRRGDARNTRIAVTGGRLGIDNCPRRCPRGYHLVLEVTTPSLAALSVADGGTIRALNGFPGQASISAAVRSGGAIDLRALAVRDVSASVMQGGVVLARPSRRLDARIVQGGRIAYWGNPSIRSVVRQGGSVGRGAAADADRPLEAFAPRVAPVPALPPLPAVPRP